MSIPFEERLNNLYVDGVAYISQSILLERFVRKINQCLCVCYEQHPAKQVRIQAKLYDLANRVYKSQ